MKTYRFLFSACFLSAAITLWGGCEDDNGDGEGSAGSASGGSASGGSASGGSASGGGAGACAEACQSLAADPECSMAGIDESVCMMVCGSGACAECLASSSACGADCEAACAGGGDSADDGSDDGSDDASDDGSDDGEPKPEPECQKNNDCGVSYECVSCNLTSYEGFCEQTEACSHDSDCGSGRVCGYNVETSQYRCVSAEFC